VQLVALRFVRQAVDWFSHVNFLSSLTVFVLGRAPIRGKDHGVMFLPGSRKR